MSVAAKHALAKIESLPSLPAVANQLLAALEDRDASYDDLAKWIEADVALTAKILRVVNSAAYGLQRRVGTVRQAIPMIGFEQLKEMCLGITLMDALPGFDSNGDRRQRSAFWEHSFACAVAARELCKYTRHAEPEGAFVAGLIHDMGKLLLAQYTPQAFATAVDEAARMEKPLVEVETNLMGTNHAVLGSALADHWELPTSHVVCVRYHHTPNAFKMPDCVEHKAILKAVTIGNHFVKTLRLGFSGCPTKKNFEAIFTALGVPDRAERGALGDRIHDGARTFKHMLIAVED